VHLVPCLHTGHLCHNDIAFLAVRRIGHLCAAPCALGL
jgi:hypothetical protein